MLFSSTPDADPPAPSARTDPAPRAASAPRNDSPAPSYRKLPDALPARRAPARTSIPGCRTLCSSRSYFLPVPLVSLDSVCLPYKAGAFQPERPLSPCLLSSLLPLLVDVHVLRVDHAFVFLLLSCASGCRGAVGRRHAALRRRTRRVSFVHGLRQLVRCLRQPLPGRVQLRRAR